MPARFAANRDRRDRNAQERTAAVIELEGLVAEAKRSGYTAHEIAELASLSVQRIYQLLPR